MNRTDYCIIAVLTLVVILFLLPALCGWRGIFFDDTYETFPRVYANAQSFQQGSLPLWSPHFFAGGRINYIPNTRVWYWPLYPFYLLAPLSTPAAAYAGLVKFPLLAHWLIGVLAAYGLGRMVIKLGRPGAIVLSVVYGFGTMISGNISAIEGIYSATWIPLAVWGIVAYAFKRQRLMGVLGALAVAFIGPCGTDVRAIFSLMTVAIALILLAAVFFFSRRGRDSRRLFLSGAVVFTIGLLLSAPYWVSMADTFLLYRGSPMLDISRAASPSSSAPWSYLLTLLIPDLFGTMTNSSLVDLGLPGISGYWHIEGNLTGGFWLAALCVLGGVTGWTRRDGNASDRSLRLWWVVGAALFAFSLLLVTGRYSPLYRWLVRVIPVFGLPYAIRWRVMEHLGIALTAGVSAHWLWTTRRPLARRILAMLLTLLLAGVFWQWSRSNNQGTNVFIHAWSSHRHWLLSSPLVYLGAAVVLTGNLFFIYRSRLANRLLVSAAVFEALAIGFSMTYFLSFRSLDIGDTRYRSPRDTLLYRQSDSPFLTNLPPPSTGQERTAFYNSLIDQMAILHGGHYLAGYCSKPLAPRLREALAEVTEGYPYELIITRPAARFFPNMSVRHLVLQQAGALPEGEADVITLPAGPDFPELYAYRLRETMPRVFTQDRIVVCSTQDAMNELLNGDLRTAAFVEEGNRLSVISDPSAPETERGFQITDDRLRIIDYESYLPGEKQESIDHFNNLQELNKIHEVRFPTPNRVEIDIEITVPSLLAITDIYYPGWEVWVDEKPDIPLQVNYLHRGVLLPGGRHRVKWIFRPRRLRWGWLGLGLGLIGVGVIIIRPRRNHIPLHPPAGKLPLSLRITHCGEKRL